MKNIIIYFKKTIFNITKSSLPILLFFGGGMAFSQPSIQWQKSLGGSDFEVAQSIQQTADGGYIVAGYSMSSDGDVNGNHGDADYWVVKLNQNGTITWQKSYGGSGPDKAQSIQQTSDGGYIVAGFSWSNDGDVNDNHIGSDFWIIKLNNTGNIEWQKSFASSLGYDLANSIEQTSDGGYIVAGASWPNTCVGDGNPNGYDYWIIKLNSVGTTIWQKSIGGSGGDWLTSIQQTADGGYIVAGTSNSNDGDVSGNHGDGDYWVAKLDNTGNIVWQKSLGGSGYDDAESIRQTTDGGYIVSGFSRSNNGNVNGNHGAADCWVVKLDNTGNIEWQKSLGGSEVDRAFSIEQTTDNGYIVAGHSHSNNGNVEGHHGGSDYWVVKLNSTGNIEWQKSLGGSEHDGAYSIQQTTSGNYIVAGYSYSNNGDVSGNHGNNDYWIVKLAFENAGIKEVNKHHKLNTYYNPHIGQVIIKYNKLPAGKYQLFVVNTLGQFVVKDNLHLSKTMGQKTYHIRGLSNGIYFVRLIGSNRKYTDKFIKY